MAVLRAILHLLLDSILVKTDICLWKNAGKILVKPIIGQSVATVLDVLIKLN